MILLVWNPYALCKTKRNSIELPKWVTNTNRQNEFYRLIIWRLNPLRSTQMNDRVAVGLLLAYPWISVTRCGCNSSSRSMWILLEITLADLMETLILVSSVLIEARVVSLLYGSAPVASNSFKRFHSLSYVILNLSSS